MVTIKHECVRCGVRITRINRCESQPTKCKRCIDRQSYRIDSGSIATAPLRFSILDTDPYSSKELYSNLRVGSMDFLDKPSLILNEVVYPRNFKRELNV